MKYVVGYTDTVSGKNRFRPFDYKNDALEFIEIKRKANPNLWAQLYEAAIEKPNLGIRCPVCRKEVPRLTDEGWCEKCGKQMEDS